MSKYNYAFKEMKENTARAVIRDIAISTKQSIEISNFIRNKRLSVAKKILEEAISMKKPIPFRRFTNGVGHKPGIGPGRYAVSASVEILKLLKSVESNAQNKGLNSDNLFIISIIPQRAATSWKYGRQRRRKAKRTNLEIVVEEIAVPKDEKENLEEQSERKGKKKLEKKKIRNVKIKDTKKDDETAMENKKEEKKNPAENKI
ncbi:MAG: 50S ribosomal protein L22 [Candidatus Woesearchaeota archaeon]